MSKMDAKLSHRRTRKEGSKWKSSFRRIAFISTRVDFAYEKGRNLDSGKRVSEGDNKDTSDIRLLYNKEFSMPRNAEKKSQVAGNSKTGSATATITSSQPAKAETKPVMAEIKPAAATEPAKMVATAPTSASVAAVVTAGSPAPAKSLATLSETAVGASTCCGGSAKASPANCTSSTSPETIPASTMTTATTPIAATPISATPASKASPAAASPVATASPIAQASHVAAVPHTATASHVTTASPIAKASPTASAAVADLIFKLRNSDADVAREAAIGLGATGSPAAVDALIV